MNPIKRKIIDSGIKLFSEKGFNATSVQEIVEDCDIAKGMLYKFFSSKEDLFLEILDNRQKIFTEQAVLILNEKKDPQDSFKKAIIYFLDFFLENKYILLKTYLPENEEITKLKKQPKLWLLNWHKDCLLKTYGDVIKKNIWDLVIIFKGIQKEYLSLLIEKNFFLSIEEVAILITKTMDAIVKDIVETRPDPILTPVIGENYLIGDLGEGINNSQSVLDDILDTMLLTISNIKNESQRKELEQSITMLGEEIEKNIPRWFLVHALLSHLENEDSITRLVRQMKKHTHNLERIMPQ